MASDLKKHLSDFLRGDKRPDLRLMHDGLAENPHQLVGDMLHVIPRHFASQLQRFLKSPATDNRPVSMSSLLLLCPHEKMKYNLEAQLILDSSVDLVWSHEYEALERNCQPNPKVTVQFVNDVEDDTAAVAHSSVDDPLPHPPPPRRRSPRLVYDPPLCPECSEMKLEEKKRQMFEFENEKIYVRKLGDRDTDFKLEEDDDAFKIGGGGGSGGCGGNANGTASYENDPEFQPGLFAAEGKVGGGVSAGKAGGGVSSGVSGKKRVSDAGIEGPEKKKGRSSSPPTVDDASAATTSATSTAASTSASTATSTSFSTVASSSAAPDVGGGDFYCVNGNNGQHSGKLGDSTDLSQVFLVFFKHVVFFFISCVFVSRV